MSESFGSGFEGLEDRTLLAAAVTTAVFNAGTGTLTLIGDGGSNEIDIYNDGDGVQGHVTVNVNGETLKLGVGGSTVSGGVYEFVGVKNIVVNSGAGNDVVDIFGVDLTGGVLVNAGAGNDNVVIGSTGLAMSTANVAPANAQTSDTNIGGSVILNGGTGNDNLTLLSNSYKNSQEQSVNDLAPPETVSGSTLSIGGSVFMNGEAGNDNLEIYAGGVNSDISIGGAANLSGGTGNDTLEVGTGSIVFDSGNNIKIALGLVMNGDAGNDFLGVENYTITQVTSSLSPAPLNPSSITVGSLFVRGWTGNDDIEVDGATVLGNAVIWGDDGNDRFCVENNSVAGSANLNGWFGNDVAHVNGNTVLGATSVSYIETFLNYCPLHNIG